MRYLCNSFTAIFTVPLSQYIIYNLDTELLWKLRAAVRSHTRGADHRTSWRSGSRAGCWGSRARDVFVTYSWHVTHIVSIKDVYLRFPSEEEEELFLSRHLLYLDTEIHKYKCTNAYIIISPFSVRPEIMTSIAKIKNICILSHWEEYTTYMIYVPTLKTKYKYSRV